MVRRELLHQPAPLIFIPWCAGGTGTGDCNGTDKSGDQSKIDPGRTLGQCQIPKATSELQFVRINS